MHLLPLFPKLEVNELKTLMAEIGQASWDVLPSVPGLLTCQGS